mgnify:CR=1 FL=1
MATDEQVKAAVGTAMAAAVAIKLPPFWPDKTDLWFAQAEAQFGLKSITVEKTKYFYVVTMLDSQTAAQAMDIIRAPPEEEPYKTLKNRLTKAFAITDDEKADKILDMDGLGDKTPSQCLTTMLNLVPVGQDPGFLFRKVFLRQLPTDVQTQLAQSTKTGTGPDDLRGLALEADRYFASMGSRISTVSRSSSRMASDPEDADISAISGRKLCFFHAKFGTKARKCEPPCQWTTSRPGTTSRGATSNPGNSQPGRGPAN